jgi:hypothetical protein
MLDADGWVAAGEDEAQLVVVHELSVLGTGSGFCAKLVGRDLLGEFASSPAAADDVDSAVPRSGDDPPGWVVRDAIARPAMHGGHEGVLHCVLGEGDVTEEPCQSCHGLAVGLAERALDVVHPPVPQ